MKHLVLLSLTLLIGIYSIMSTPHVYGGDTDTSTCLSGVLSTFRARLRTATTATMADLIADVRSEMRVCTGGSGGSSSVTRGTTSTSSSNGDPGSGLWMPPGMSGVYVVDPRFSTHNSGRIMNDSLLPSINGTVTRPGSGTAFHEYKRTDYYRDPRTGTTIDLKPGKVISLRARMGENGSYGDIRVPSVGDTTNLGFLATMSVSTAPNDFSNEACTDSSNGRLMVLVATKYGLWSAPNNRVCIIPPNTNYYVNIRVETSQDVIRKSTPYTDTDGTTRYNYSTLSDGNCVQSDIYCPTVAYQFRSSAGSIGNKFSLGSIRTSTPAPSSQSGIHVPRFADGDPGRGLWMPQGTNKLYVLDPGDISRGASQILGTVNLYTSDMGSTPQTHDGINSIRPNFKTLDYYKDIPTGKRVDLKAGNTIALRYRTGNEVKSNEYFPVGTVFGYFKFSGSHGERYPYKTRVSASRTPGDFSSCNATMSSTSTDMIYISSKPPLQGTVFASKNNVCIIPPNTDYYLNIRMEYEPGYIMKVTKGSDGYYTREPINDGNCVSESIDCPHFKLVPVYTGGYFGGLSPLQSQSTQSTNTNTSSIPNDVSGERMFFLSNPTVGSSCSLSDKEWVKQQVCNTGTMTMCTVKSNSPGGSLVEYRATNCASNITTTQSLPNGVSKNGAVTMFTSAERIGNCSDNDKSRLKKMICESGTITSCKIDRVSPGGSNVLYTATGCDKPLPEKHFGPITFLKNSTIDYTMDMLLGSGIETLATGVPVRGAVPVGGVCSEDHFVSVKNNDTLIRDESVCGIAVRACYVGRVFVQKCE